MARRKNKPPKAAGGAMPLMAHLREFRQRLIWSVIAIAIASIVGWVFYDVVFEWLKIPYDNAVPALEGKGVDSEFVFTGIGGGFQFQLRISLIVGVLLSSPVWLWQFWAFVLPGMHRHERKAALLLTGTCIPLFTAGAYFGYVMMPKVVEILIGFVPRGSSSLLTATDYFTFMTRMMLVFGLGALLPVVIVALNRVGVLSAKALVHARPWSVVGIFVFAAIATPTPDPGTMTFLAVPLTVLYFVAETLVRIHDKRHPREEIE